MYLRTSLIAAAVGLAVVAASVEAQSCNVNWTDPVACEVRVGVAAPGDRVQTILDGQPVSVPAGSSLRIEVQATDQFGYAFPADRLLPQLEIDRVCSELITLAEDGGGSFSINAGTRRGTCRLFLWIPGNLNLEWPLDLEVVSALARGYTRQQAELVVTSLYQGILGRDPEPAGLQGSTAEVLRGRLDHVVAGIYDSPEFQTQRGRRPPLEHLDDLYQGLLGREVDADGIRSHLGDVEAGRYSQVVLEMVGSPEFEQRLLESVSP